MLCLAIASIAIIGWVELRDLEWPDPTFRRLALIDLVFVAIFLGDFVAGLRRAHDKRAFLRTNWYELVGLIPLYVESWTWLRAFRLLRVVRLLRLLRFVPAARRLFNTFTFLRRLVRDSHILYLLGLAGTLILIVATGFWILEHRTNEGIREFDDALWWAMSTVTTVGYGDIAPRTGIGRMLAAFLMLFGIGLIGALGASLTATMVRMYQQEDDKPSSAVEALLDEHERIVVERERGTISAEEYRIRRSNLMAIAKIKTEAD